MAEHWNTLSREAERIREELQQYFFHSSTACPYGLPFKAAYNQAFFDTMPDFIMAAYLAAGYRRNGNIIYNMHCSECSACVPIRIDPQEFKPSRNQKRVWSKNRDITVETAPLSCSAENLALLEKFLAAEGKLGCAESQLKVTNVTSQEERARGDLSRLLQVEGCGKKGDRDTGLERGSDLRILTRLSLVCLIETAAC